VGKRLSVSARGRGAASKPEVVWLQYGGLSFGGVARAAATLTTKVSRQVWLRSVLPSHGGEESWTRQIAESPALLRGEGHSHVFLPAVGSWHSFGCVGKQWQKKERAASELSAVLGFARFSHSRWGDGFSPGCSEVSFRFGEGWSSDTWKGSLTGCSEVSLSFGGDASLSPSADQKCWHRLRSLSVVRKVWRVSWSVAQCESA